MFSRILRMRLRNNAISRKILDLRSRVSSRIKIIAVPVRKQQLHTSSIKIINQFQQSTKPKHIQQSTKPKHITLTNSFKGNGMQRTQSVPITKKINVILDSDGGGDIDDALAWLIFLSGGNWNPLAITTTHIEPELKAKIAQLYVNEFGQKIPVYSGIGCTRTDSKKDFLAQNPLFNPAFGYPNPNAGEKSWYPKQGDAYKQAYKERFNEIKINNESAPEVIVRHAKQYSTENPLIIVAIGPLHNIDAALKLDPSIAKNIKIYSMGGLHPKGYNWLISPDTTARVLSQVETECVSSEFIAKNNFYITPEEWDIIERNVHSTLGKAIIQDLRNWHKGDINHKKNTFIYDPVTLYLALNTHRIKSINKQRLTFPCLDANGQIKSEFVGKAYSHPELKDQIVATSNEGKPNVTFITEVDSAEGIRKEIIAIITQQLTNKLNMKLESKSAPLVITKAGIFGQIIPANKNEIDHKAQTVNLIRDARKSFLDEKQSEVKTFQGLVKVFIKKINGKKYRIFGVKKEDQSQIDYKKLQEQISTELGFKEVQPFKQIIGDSSLFSEEGSDRSRKYFSNAMANDCKSIVMYGFTGNKSPDNKCVDTNQIVNEWVEKDSEISNRVIANIVDEHTVTAIEKWGCSIAANVKNFFLVYSEGCQPTVKFGDDIILSDNLTNANVTCFEGGIQSLQQMLNMINHNIPIDGLQGLRDLSLEKNIDPVTKLPYLSAVQFLDFIKQKTAGLHVVSLQIIDSLIKEYFISHAKYNNSNPDSITKEPLLISALSQLSTSVLNKLNLINSDTKESDYLHLKL